MVLRLGTGKFEFTDEVVEWRRSLGVGKLEFTGGSVGGGGVWVEEEFGRG